MTLNSHLENLRGKPDHVKRQIALGSALVVTLVIFTFWIGSFTSIGKSTEQSVAHAVSQAGTPAQSLTASVGGLFTDIKDLIFKPRVVTYTNIEVSPGK